MKIGFNVKNIINNFQETIYYLSRKIVQNENNIANHETRISTLENSSGDGGSEWVEITSSNGQEAEITQEFSEIRMLCRCDTDVNFSVTYNFDNSIFHNTIGKGARYFICGNPIENNYGCRFKYYVSFENKQYVSINNCFTGGALTNNYTFKAWIKPTTNKQ